MPCRTDVIYELGRGRVYIVAHVPDAAAPVELRLSAAPAADAPGPAAPGPALVLQYQPAPAALDAAGLAVNAAVAAALTAGAGASLVTHLLAPLSNAGAGFAHIAGLHLSGLSFGALTGTWLVAGRPAPPAPGRRGRRGLCRGNPGAAPPAGRPASGAPRAGGRAGAGALTRGARAAGVMGHAMLALVAWAQRCCLLAGLGARGLPPAFRGFGAAFAWSVADVASPFDGLADPAARGWPAGEPGRGLAPTLVRLDAAGGLAEALPLPLNSTAPLAALAGYPGPDADPSTVRAQPPAWLLRPEALRQSPAPPAPPAPPPSDASHAAGLEPAVDDLLRPYFPICAPPVTPSCPPAHACLTRAHAPAQPCGSAGHSGCVFSSGILLNERRWRGQGVEVWHILNDSLQNSTVR